MTFEDIYKAPFRSEYGYIWSSDNVMALMAINYEDGKTDSMLSRLVSILNGESKPNKTNAISYDAPEIVINGVPTLVIRGWGFLTGNLGLSEENACRIQDDFGKWIVEQLVSTEE